LKKLTTILLITLLLVGIISAGAAAEKEIAVLTPYLESVTTNTLVRTFETQAEEMGWDVSVTDTGSDYEALAGRFQDAITRDVDAIVMGMGDANQVSSEIAEAAEAGIPVVAGDADLVEGMLLNVTSNNYVIASQAASYLFNDIQEGKIVKLYHSGHPGVHRREIVFDAIADFKGDIEIVDDHYVEVPGPIEDSQNAMQSILLSHSDIDGIWAAWDEPAIGAALAVMEAGLMDDITIVGSDGNEQALEMIRDGGPLKATVRQDFEAMAEILVDQLEVIFAGEEVTDSIMYAPTELITRDNVEEYID